MRYSIQMLSYLSFICINAAMGAQHKIQNKPKSNFLTSTDRLNFRFIEKYAADWPSYSLHGLTHMIDQLGLPQTIKNDEMSWGNRAPFKKISVHKTGVRHDFPFHHQDFISHTISYKADPNYLDDLFQFNGSLTLNRTKGELTIQCYGGPLNVAILNIAHSILSLKKNYSQARSELHQIAKEIFQGKIKEFASRLIFTPVQHTQDPDVSTMNEIQIKQAQEENPEEEEDIEKLLKASREEMTE